MSRYLILTAVLLVFAGVSVARERVRDRILEPFNITDVDPRYTVMSPEVQKQVWTQEVMLQNIQGKLDETNRKLGDLEKDIRTLMDTNVVINFVMGAIKILVPGLLITWFGIWYSKRPKNPARKTA